MILKCVKVVAAAAFALVSLNVSGQDLLARQAPIDRKLKAVDSVALIRQIKGGNPCTKEEFLSFHNRISHGYEEIMSGDRNVLFKMKELWAYWESLFIGEEKRIKKIKKANSLAEYHAAVSFLLEQADFHRI